MTPSPRRKRPAKRVDVVWEIASALESQFCNSDAALWEKEAKAVVRRLKRLGLLVEKPEERITKKDMRHLIGRSERLLRRVKHFMTTGMRHDAELMMAHFKLSNTCKEWRKILKSQQSQPRGRKK